MSYSTVYGVPYSRLLLGAMWHCRNRHLSAYALFFSMTSPAVAIVSRYGLGEAYYPWNDHLYRKLKFLEIEAR